MARAGVSVAAAVTAVTAVLSATPAAGQRAATPLATLPAPAPGVTVAPAPTLVPTAPPSPAVPDTRAALPPFRTVPMRAALRATGARPGGWNPAWRRADWFDYALTAASGFLYWYVWYVAPSTQQITWRGPVLFDGPVHDLLADSDLATRRALTHAADATIDALFGVSLALDPMVAVFRGNADVGWELFWQSALVQLLNGAVQAGIRHPIGRQRPSYYDCQDRHEQALCTSDWAENQSFPSGHASTVAASAALVCTQHLNVHLYGGPWDAVACGSAIGAAAFVGVARIVSDDHWATDVLAGYAVGAAMGWAVPTLLHYAWHLRGPPRSPDRAARARANAPRMTLLPTAGTRTGLALVGMF
jgi:membrane-associated phospholipid phosphatase